MLRYNSSITLCTRTNIYVLLKIGPGAGEGRGKKRKKKISEQLTSRNEKLSSSSAAWQCSEYRQLRKTLSVDDMKSPRNLPMYLINKLENA